VLEVIRPAAVELSAKVAREGVAQHDHAVEALRLELKSARYAAERAERQYDAAEPENLVARWKKAWPFPGIEWKGERWVEPDMEDVFTAYSQGYHAVLKPLAS